MALARASATVSWGNLDPEGDPDDLHSPVQIKIEYLADMAEYHAWWVPFSVYGDCSLYANWLMINRILNPTGWLVGDPRPL